MEIREMAQQIHDNFRDSIPDRESLPVPVIEKLIERFQDQGIEVNVVTEPMTRFLVECEDPHWIDVTVKAIVVGEGLSIVIKASTTKIFLYQWYNRPQLAMLDDTSILRMAEWR
jgi:phosphoglycolate phosphatase-like HAD superfamily hydrolase